MAGISDGLLDAVDEEVRRITDGATPKRGGSSGSTATADAIVVQLPARKAWTSRKSRAAGVARPAVTPTPAPLPA